MKAFGTITFIAACLLWVVGGIAYAVSNYPAEAAVLFGALVALGVCFLMATVIYSMIYDPYSGRGV